MHVRHLRGQVAGVEQPGFENLPGVQGEPLQSAGEDRLVVDLQTERKVGAADHEQPADGDLQAGFLPDLPGHGVSRLLALLRESAREAPLLGRIPEAVAEQEHAAVAVADDPGDAAVELGVQEPEEPSLERSAHPPQPGQEFVHDRHDNRPGRGRGRG